MKYVNLKIANELRSQEQKQTKELELVAGTIIGIGLFTVPTAYNNEIANADTNTTIVSNANSVSEDSNSNQATNSNDHSATSTQSSQATSSTTGNNNVANSNSSNSSDSSANISSSSQSSLTSSSNDDQSLSYRGDDSLDDDYVKLSNAAIDNGADNNQNYVESSIQHIVHIKGTKGYEHPYVVRGKDGDVVTLPNGQQVKINGTQLVDPNTNKAFNNNDKFDQGSFTPEYQNYTVQIRFKFVDQNKHPVAVSYNNFNPSGYQTYKVTVKGYDGEPFSLYYKDIIDNQFSGFTPQQIGNQNNPLNGTYVEAILGHGLMNGNDPIILKGASSYAKVRYYVTTNDGSRRYFDTNEVQTGNSYNSQSVDVQTPFNNYDNGIKLSDYFTLPTNLPPHTFQPNTSPDNPSIIDVNLIPKPITEKLRVLVRSVIDSNETYPATITMTGSYGNKSNYSIQSGANLQFTGTNPLDPSAHNTLLNNNTTLTATLGADSDDNTANYGSDKYLWQQDDLPKVSWDNANDPAAATPVLYYIPVNVSNQVQVPNLLFNFRFWGPKNIDGSGYDTSNSDNNISGDPYNANNRNQTGLVNDKNGAINYRTYYNWQVTSDKYAPVNTIYDEYQWSYPGFSSDGDKNHLLIQLTDKGPVQLYVMPDQPGTMLENQNQSGELKYIALQGFPSQIPNAQQAYDKNHVAGYLIPKNAFGYQGPDANDTIFYPAGARIISEWHSGQPLVYHDGNYYYDSDVDFKNPIQLKTTGTPLPKVSANSDTYYIGDVNAYAQPHQITLKYLDTNNVDSKNPTISASGLPNANQIESKTITAYTEDRIYYDQNQNAFFLTRYGKVGKNGQINTDINDVTTKLFDAPAGYNYDDNTQTKYASYNYQIDQSHFGGLSVASWIAGIDSTTNINVTSNEMHPYGPDGADNVAAVYMQSNGDQTHNVVVNLVYINLTNGSVIDRDTKNEIYDSKNPNSLNDISTYLPITKSPYGTLIINDSRFSKYQYIASFPYSLLSNNNTLKTAYVYLLPFDPNDPNSPQPNIQKYPLNIHYVDEKGNPIDDQNHDFKVTGVKSQTVNEAMQASQQSFWSYGNEKYERVGVKLDLLNNSYYANSEIDSLFNRDSASNNNQIFGKHLNVYIVLRKQYVPNSNIPNHYPSSSNGGGGSGSGGSSHSSSNNSNSSKPTHSASNNGNSHSSSTNSNSSKPTNSNSNNGSSKSSSTVNSSSSADYVRPASYNGSSANSTASVTNSNSHANSNSASHLTSSTSFSSSTSHWNQSSSSSHSNHSKSTSFNSSARPSNQPSSISSNSLTSANNQQAKLPQTGEVNRTKRYGVIGIALLALSGLLFNNAKRKRRKK